MNKYDKHNVYRRQMHFDFTWSLIQHTGWQNNNGTWAAIEFSFRYEFKINFSLFLIHIVSFLSFAFY